MNTGIKGRPSTHGDHYQLNTSTLIRHAARTYPEQEIVFRTQDGGWDRYTYADCYTRIKQAANVLRGLGVGPADVVGILDWNSKRHFELYWAIPNLGAVMLQMNVRLSAEDLGYVTDHSEASWVLVDDSLLPVAEALAPYAPNVKGWIVMTDKGLSFCMVTSPFEANAGSVQIRCSACRMPVARWPVRRGRGWLACATARGRCCG